MPEIYEMFFGLSELFRFFSKNKEIQEEIKLYEEKLEQDMAINRSKLFGF